MIKERKRWLSAFMALAMLMSVLVGVPISAENTGTSTDDNGIVLTKTLVSGLSEQQPKRLKLEAYTTGRVELNQESAPADIVLVLDQSGSMKDQIDGKTKLSMMKTAVTDFVASVA